MRPRYSTATFRAYPLCPANGSWAPPSSKARGSVVGRPSRSTTHPGGSCSPRRARVQDLDPGNRRGREVEHHRVGSFLDGEPHGDRVGAQHPLPPAEGGGHRQDLRKTPRSDDPHAPLRRGHLDEVADAPDVIAADRADRRHSPAERLLHGDIGGDHGRGLPEGPAAVDEGGDARFPGGPAASSPAAAARRGSGRRRAAGARCRGCRRRAGSTAPGGRRGRRRCARPRRRRCRYRKPAGAACPRQSRAWRISLFRWEEGKPWPAGTSGGRLAAAGPPRTDLS